jgi:hypothetical protein
MISLRLKIISYDKDRNTCKAELLNGDIVEIDPFVSCALALTDDDYVAGHGADVVGGEYILTEYTVYKNNIVPHEGGIISL